MSEITASATIEALDRIIASVRTTRQQIVDLGSSAAQAAKNIRLLPADTRRLKPLPSITLSRLHGQTPAQARQPEQRGDTAIPGHEPRATLEEQSSGDISLAAAIVRPVRAAIRFESIMARVKEKATFDTPRQFQQMRKDLLHLSAHIPLTIRSLGQIAEATVGAGLARENFLKLTEQAARMGVAFEMTGKQAGSAMTGLMKTFHTSAEGATDVANAYSRLSHTFTAPGKELVTIAYQTGHLAVNMGISAQQVGAFGAILTDLGTPTQAAGTALEALFNQFGALESQPPQFLEALASIGISVDDFQQSLKKDAGSTLLDFFQRIHKAGDLGQQALFDMFGMKHTPLLIRFANHSGKLAEAIDLVGDSSQYAGSMEKDYAARAATTAFQLQILHNKANVLGVTMGSYMLPTVNAAASRLGELSNVLAKLSEEFPVATKWAFWLVGLKAAAIVFRFMLGGLFDTLAFGVRSVKRLGTSVSWLARIAHIGKGASALYSLGVRALGQAFRFGAAGARLFAQGFRWIGKAMMATPIGRMLTLLTAVGAAGVFIYKNWGLIKEKIAAVWAWVKEICARMAGIIPDSVKGFFSFGGEDGKPSTSSAKPGKIALAGRYTPGPPLTASRSTSIQTSVNAPITVHAAPGMDESALARHIGEELDKRQRQAGAQARAVLHDIG